MTVRQAPEIIVRSILLPHQKEHQKDAYDYKEIKHGWSKILAIGHRDFKSMAHT